METAMNYLPEAGLTKGYSDKEVVSSVVRAVQPGLQLRSY